VYTFTSAKEENALFGRIDESTVNFTFKNKYKELDLDQYFICGPEEMILLASDTLKTNGVTEEAIKYELFTASATEEVTEGATEGIADGKTEITVMIDDEETTFVADASKFLLDAVMAEDLDPPYSCQGGVCSSCIAKVTEGEATMVKNQILTDSEVKEGLILTCQAHAKTAQIKLDYDDV
jgi:ring-1,2-phenylacetyl-CoA epoxidase subunit PaaE